MNPQFQTQDIPQQQQQIQGIRMFFRIIKFFIYLFIYLFYYYEDIYKFKQGNIYIYIFIIIVIIIIIIIF